VLSFGYLSLHEQRKVTQGAGAEPPAISCLTSPQAIRPELRAIILDFSRHSGIMTIHDHRTEKVTMTRVTVYSTGACPYCTKAKQLLQKWNIPFDEVRVDVDKSKLRELAQVTNGARTVPQIVIDGKCIGGFTELTELHMEGGLDELIEAGGSD
jgi:glutaredoxin 3